MDAIRSCCRSISTFFSGCTEGTIKKVNACASGIQNSLENSVSSISEQGDRIHAKWLSCKQVIQHGQFGYITVASSVGNSLKTWYSRSVDFAIENRDYLIVYSILIVIFIIYIGAIHGFKQVAEPFTIGYCVGGVLGAITGVVRVAKGWAKKDDPKNTLWNTAEYYFKKLNKTLSSLATALVVYGIFFGAVGTFPSSVGGAAGFIMFSHLLTKVGLRIPMGTVKKKEEEKPKSCTSPLPQLPS